MSTWAERNPDELQAKRQEWGEEIKDIGRKNIDDLKSTEPVIGRWNREVDTHGAMTVTTHTGDLSSDTPGTGARDNGGKLAVETIPARCWAASFRGSRSLGATELELITCVEDLGFFQEGKIDGDMLLQSVPPKWFEYAIEVFQWGADQPQYDMWNWLKGMKWTVPHACAIRHARDLIIGHEREDPESGLPHLGHFLCNIIMLSTFYYTYPEGNDYPEHKFWGNSQIYVEGKT